MPRLVLYAEGAGELLGSITQLRPVGMPLKREMLGTAHILIERLCQHQGAFNNQPVRFDSPNRIRGRLARGSDLLDERSLRELLVSVRSEQRPDLAIVLVDADGNRQRANDLTQMTRTMQIPSVVAVSVQEFEAWLIADHQSVRESAAWGHARGHH